MAKKLTKKAVLAALKNSLDGFDELLEDLGYEVDYDIELKRDRLVLGVDREWYVEISAHVEA